MDQGFKIAKEVLKLYISNLAQRGFVDADFAWVYENILHLF